MSVSKDGMRAVNRIVADTLTFLAEKVKPGVAETDLDKWAEELIRDRGARPAFKGYDGFPATLCVSVNDQLIHGVPTDRTLRTGDIVSLDLGAKIDGCFADSALTVVVGEPTGGDRKLMRTTRQALYQGIQQARPGERLQAVESAIYDRLKTTDFGVVTQWAGHGIGDELHKDPKVLNKPRGDGPVLETGMYLAIEPMVSQGRARTEIADDSQTVVMADGSRSAHFEHTIAVAEQPEILTSRPDEPDCL